LNYQKGIEEYFKLWQIVLFQVVDSANCIDKRGAE
jgi:hypothetical protein